MFKYANIMIFLMSTTKEETIEITKNIVIDAPPEVVFKAITDQNQLTN